MTTSLAELKILSARVEPSKRMEQAKVFVKLLENGPEIELFSFYDDELHFAPEEFIGLTIEQGHALFTKKDVAYLQS